MTDTHRTPSPTAAAHHERPFTGRPGRWEKERVRALRTAHVPGRTCTAAFEPVLVYERARWGWLGWTVPGDGSPPEIPHQIGVLTPAATRTQRLALYWLTRRPARHLALATVPKSLRCSTACVALISLLTALFAARHGIPVDVVLPAVFLPPLLAEHLPDRLDARAREHVRMVEGDGPCRYLRRLAALQTYLVQAATGGRDCHEVRHPARIGQHVLWDAAGLLKTPDARTTVWPELIARERLMLQLAHQVAQIVERSASEDGAPDTDQRRASWQPTCSYPQDVRPTSRSPHLSPSPALLKGTLPMLPSESSPVVRTPDVYLLFAHEPYYPGPGTQEINTTVVVAGSLLHPRVRQPDGTRIHDLLTRGRRQGEIIPLATLSHELGGGADWPRVGDWERVTTGLLHLVRCGDCDALSLGLPEIARALVCTGPGSHVRAYDAAADDFIDYGPTDRAAVLTEVDTFLTSLVAEQKLWPGDGLLSPINPGDAR
ncbi:hypothetical protein ACFY1L_50340 [Streptomyces sp. NPDC001663]|uniref:hypothetical protein n=1 Tax=Streptomyces sp. NPDC001663 TaxID=3364597 RepID=UPI0036CA5058